MKTSLWSLSQHCCLLSLLLLLQLSSSSAGQFRVIGPGHPIRALVGDEAELPCRISPGKNATGMEVGWYRPPFSRVVHLYRNGKDQDAEQAPEYRGRTELLKETIAEGKVTLRIRNVRFSDEGGFTCFFRDHSYQEEAAMELKVEDPFYWVSPGVLVLIALLPTLFLQVSVGLVFLFLQHRLRGKLRAEVENLHRTFDPHFLRVPCWKITLFVIVPVLGPLVALIICYNWLHRRLAGQFLEELKNTPWLRPDSLSEDTHVPVKYRNDCTEQDIQNFYITNYRTSTLQIVTASSKKKQVKNVKNSNVESRGLWTEKSPQCQGKLSELEYEYKNLSQNLEMESKEN